MNTTDLECECGEYVGSDYREDANRIVYTCPRCGKVEFFKLANGRWIKKAEKELN